MTIHIGFLLETRTIVTALALIFSLMILGDTRKIYRTPWAFGFIALRCLLALLLRGAIWLQLPLDPHIPEGVKTVSEVLILFAVIGLWLGYGTVFDETPFRKWIRAHWPFK